MFCVWSNSSLPYIAVSRPPVPSLTNRRWGPGIRDYVPFVRLGFLRNLKDDLRLCGEFMVFKVYDILASDAKGAEIEVKACFASVPAIKVAEPTTLQRSVSRFR